MKLMRFEVCRHRRSGRWMVRLNHSTYGAYIDKEHALFDAIDAARDVQQTGCDAQVWVRDQTRTERVL
jgi:hypothetical protein